MVGDVGRLEALALVPGGELGECPAGPAVVRRVRVRVIVDDGPRAVAHQARHGTRQHQRGEGKQHQGRWSE